jgi:hypothetical protein
MIFLMLLARARAFNGNVARVEKRGKVSDFGTVSENNYFAASILALQRALVISLCSSNDMISCGSTENQG